MTPRAPSQRIVQLDCLRGLAACSVIIGHYFLVLKGNAQPFYAHVFAVFRMLDDTPLRILWEGHAAVVLFFTLSGFVLYLLLERTRLPLGAYAIKRVVRLYLPYLAAVVLGVLGEYLLAGPSMAGLGRWINKFWSWPIDARAIAAHLIVLGPFNSDRFDFTIWTLVHELRISLLFPLIFLMVQRLRWWSALMPFVIASAAVVIVQQPAVPVSFHAESWVTRGGLTAYVLTVHYLLAFTLGALIAGHRQALRRRYRRLGPAARVLLGVLALALYIYGAKLMAVTGLKTMMPYDWPLMAGAAVILAVAAFETRIAAALDRPAFRWLGRISYSLYLFHPLVLLAALHLFYDRLPLGPLLLASLLATFLLGELAYRGIERPAVRASRWSSTRAAELSHRLSVRLRARRIERTGRSYG